MFCDDSVHVALRKQRQSNNVVLQRKKVRSLLEDVDVKGNASIRIVSKKWLHVHTLLGVLSRGSRFVFFFFEQNSTSVFPFFYFHHRFLYSYICIYVATNLSIDTGIYDMSQGVTDFKIWWRTHFLEVRS